MKIGYCYKYDENTYYTIWYEYNCIFYGIR